MAGTVSRLERHLERSIREFFEVEVKNFFPIAQIVKEDGGKAFQLRMECPDLKISIEASVRQEREPR